MLSHTFSGVSGDARALTEELGATYSGGGVRHGLNGLGHLLRHGAWQRVDRPQARAAPTTAERPNSERAVLDFLAAQGVPVIPARIATTADAAVAFARNLDATVVLQIASPDRSEERRVGKEGVSTCRSRGAPAH